MHALSDEQVVRVWTHGQGRHPLDRALLVLAVAFPEASWDELAHLPLGSRDALLLDLYASSFGTAVDVLTGCPRCGAWLELALTTGELRLPLSPTPGVSVELAAWRLELRRPDSTDLAAVLAVGDPRLARETLLRRLVVAASYGDADVPPAHVPMELLEEAVPALETPDAQADLLFALECPTCSHAWRAVFDIGSFLWEAIGRRARRVQGDVHTLASSYGWSEREILSMHERWRDGYLSQVRRA
jgi:hypothetical protein